MDKIRILFVIDGLEYGGGERVFLQLATGLRDRYQVFVAAMPGGRFEQELNKFGVKFCPVDMSRQLSLKPIRQLREVILTQEIDLLHSQGARADFFSRMAGRTTGRCHIICTIATMVERFNVGPSRKRIYLLIDSLTERYVEKFVVVSNSLKNALIQRRKLLSSKIVKIYNGIELDKYWQEVEQDSLRNEWGISKDISLIGAIGRMVWEKGFKYLIEAIPEIVRVVPEAMFLFVGDGPLKKDIEDLAKSLKVEERIIFTGFRSDIKEILSTIDILVIPSLLEGFPMITLEGMAMAKPIIATNIDGITEQITDGENGILVPAKDPDALAKATIKILGDKESAKAMGMAARKKVEQKFSVERMVAETEKVYLSLLKYD